MKPKTKRLNLAVQAIALKKDYPQSECHVQRSELLWRGHLQPSFMSRRYLVQLIYKLGKSPKIKVIYPPLEKRDGKKPPHLYKGDFLCVYLPGAGEWAGEKLLAATILPWVSEWLLHYEIWLATGTWQGGGIHPAGQKRVA